MGLPYLFPLPALNSPVIFPVFQSAQAGMWQAGEKGPWLANPAAPLSLPGQVLAPSRVSPCPAQSLHMASTSPLSHLLPVSAACCGLSCLYPRAFALTVPAISAFFPDVCVAQAQALCFTFPRRSLFEITSLPLAPPSSGPHILSSSPCFLYTSDCIVYEHGRHGRNFVCLVHSCEFRA